MKHQLWRCWPIGGGEDGIQNEEEKGRLEVLKETKGESRVMKVLMENGVISGVKNVGGHSEGSQGEKTGGS